MSPQTLKTNGFLNLKPFQASRFHFLALLLCPSVVCVCLLRSLQVSSSWTVERAWFCCSLSRSALIHVSILARLIPGNAYSLCHSANQGVFTSLCGLFSTGWFPNMASKRTYCLSFHMFVQLWRAAASLAIPCFPRTPVFQNMLWTFKIFAPRSEMQNKLQASLRSRSTFVSVH